MAPEAHILWHAAFDPGALPVTVVPADFNDPERLDPATLKPWLTVTVDTSGCEHAVLSDGWHHIRLDIEAGTLVAGRPVVLHYRLHGLAGADRKLTTLRRLIHLCRFRRFARSLFAPDPGIRRGIMLLRVHDGLAAGASQREIGRVLFGKDRIADDWGRGSDSLRSRVRRLVVDATAMANGRYLSIMNHDELRYDVTKVTAGKSLTP